MKKITTITIVALSFFGLALLAPSPDALAQVTKIQEGINAVNDSPTTTPTLIDSVKDIINTLLYIIGAVAVVMIIFGGFKYVTSSGESSAVASAKNTILYSVIGLVVAVSAFAIVNYVTGIFNDDPATSIPKPESQNSNGVIHQ